VPGQKAIVYRHIHLLGNDCRTGTADVHLGSGTLPRTYLEEKVGFKWRRCCGCASLVKDWPGWSSGGLVIFWSSAQSATAAGKHRLAGQGDDSVERKLRSGHGLLFRLWRKAQQLVYSTFHLGIRQDAVQLGGQS
jgi:hypothetical protein